MFMMSSSIKYDKKTTIKKALKWVFSGFSIFFIVVIFFMVFHDIMTGESYNTAEYCAKYGVFVSPNCWELR
jgi:hypothetical protein